MCQHARIKPERLVGPRLAQRDISRHAGSRLLLSDLILPFWQRSMAPPKDLPSHQLANMVLMARLMVEAALLRQESRGSHYREDFFELPPGKNT